MIFNLDNPSKKFPKANEIDNVIHVVKYIQNNIILLDPLDQDQQSTKKIPQFKQDIIDYIKELSSENNT